jgi:hypothetical protein
MAGGTEDDDHGGGTEDDNGNDEQAKAQKFSMITRLLLQSTGMAAHRSTASSIEAPGTV